MRAGAILAMVAVVLVSTSCAEGVSKSAVEPGDLLSSTPLSGAAVLPSAGRSELITYASSDADDHTVVVSGTVSVPKGEEPEGGWPVISWAHGTTGVADTCAPSNDTADGPAHDYLGGVNAVLDKYVADGFAVVQTDYVGLGTPGGHPYMNGVTEANAVTDIVRAARDGDRALSSDWYVMGHSQGGHAALWTAATAGDRAPDLTLKGAVSIAPGGDVSPMVDMLRSGDPAMAPALGFFPLILLGAEAGDPTIDADSYATPESASLLTAGRAGCIAAIRGKVGGVPVGKAFATDADFPKLTAYLRKQSPSSLKLQVPTLVLQGTADTTIIEPGTKQLVSQLCSNGNAVAYRTYDGADHRAAVPRGFDDTMTFVKDVSEGKTFPGTC